MKSSSYVRGIFAKLLAIILVVVGLVLFFYSEDISQQNGAPIELYWIVSWILFIAGIIMFAAAVVMQRRAVQRLKRETSNIRV
ncbi:MAG: hypothetical protein WED04_09355 [Promethearchaeati archaeon SRVP18_Atabeyarchaeia-1]